ncbi:MAG: formate/nitrite transporter family protein, partial [Chloroflexi bacterium]|nr:formate/nitrite transporter family protein [Chloroflexota bacterium]
MHDSTENGDIDESQSGAPAGGYAVRDFFSTDEIFRRVAASAHEEFALPVRMLFLSGLAAGLSIGLSFLARASVTALIPQDSSGLVGNLLYPIGFLLIVLGRYQLFTENTLTPVTLVLTRIASIPALLRNWGIVLGANLLGAITLAVLLSVTNVFNPETAEVAREFARHAIEFSAIDLLFKGIIAGWLVASMVWLIHAARETISRFAIVFVLMYFIPTADLYHCIVGACEVAFLVFEGGTNVIDALFGFFIPVLIGNTIGGVLLVGILNYAQTKESRFPGY